MQLNLKDPETHAMVTRLAQATGMSRARAVKDAVREKLNMLERARDEEVRLRVERVLALADSIRSRLPEKLPTQAEMDDWMYGEDGLPR